jgi:hypothetical protein
MRDRKIVEGQQGVAVFVQAFCRLGVLSLIGRYEGVEGRVGLLAGAAIQISCSRLLAFF